MNAPNRGLAAQSMAGALQQEVRRGVGRPRGPSAKTLLKRQLELEQIPGPSAWSAEDMQVESPRANYEANGPGSVEQVQQNHVTTNSLRTEDQKQVDASVDTLRAKPVKPLERYDGDNLAAVSWEFPSISPLCRTSCL